MKIARPPASDQTAIDLLEESLLLLRRTSPATLACYFLGALPFVLALLFFWADMSWGAEGWGHLLPGSLALALLYLWMKCWQAIFAGRLRGELTGQGAPRWTSRRLLRLLLVQAAIAPWSWLALPVALAITAPFGWCFAFFQNLTVLGHGAEPALPTVQRAWRQAILWPGQNHLLLGFFLLFVPVLFANLAVAAAALPHLLSSLFGIESIFTRGHFSFVNTTFLAAVTALTFLIADPLIKTVYVLRCFHGDALQTGDDLRVELRRLATRALLLAGLALPLWSIPAAAGATAAPAMTAEALDRSLDEVLTGLEYTWRLPRVEPPAGETDPGFLATMLNTLTEWVRSFFRWVGEIVVWLYEKARDLFPSSSPVKTDAAPDWEFFALYLFIAAALSLAGIWLRRSYRRRRKPPAPAAGAGAPAVLDLEGEDVAADLLPVSEWLTLGRDLLHGGNVRLGVRAMFLAVLAHLGDQQLLTLHRTRSNREYLRELQRRGHSLPALVEAFARIVTVIDRTWYGQHPVDRETLGLFLADQERILAHGRR